MKPGNHQRLHRRSRPRHRSDQRSGPRDLRSGARHRSSEDVRYRILGEARRHVPSGSTRRQIRASPLADPAQKPALLSGGGGMFSTAGDYARFSQMLPAERRRARRAYGSSRPRPSLWMTSDQLPVNTERHTPVAMALGAFGPVPEMGTSFGLGFAVRVDPGRNPLPGSVGDFSWGGITGTLFWVDPESRSWWPS